MENSFLKLLLIIYPFLVYPQYETQQFELISDFDGIEIRYYPPSMMVKHNGNNGFRNLFGYISGKNDLKKKISMIKKELTFCQLMLMGLTIIYLNKLTLNPN